MRLQTSLTGISTLKTSLTSNLSGFDLNYLDLI